MWVCGIGACCAVGVVYMSVMVVDDGVRWCAPGSLRWLDKTAKLSKVSLQQPQIELESERAGEVEKHYGQCSFIMFLNLPGPFTF